MILIENEAAMKQFGERVGVLLRGGELLELVGDVGAGKTTFAKGLALGLSINEPIQSPTFTINRVYAARDDLQLVHYDFYRLSEAGIMADELNEVVHDPASVTVIEWGGIAADVLPTDRLTITIAATAEDERRVTLHAGGPTSSALQDQIV